jgi:hypothetical protein
VGPQAALRGFESQKSLSLLRIKYSPSVQPVTSSLHLLARCPSACTLCSTNNFQCQKFHVYSTLLEFYITYCFIERNQTFNRHLMHPSSTLKMEASGFSATMVPIYQITHTPCHTPEDWNFYNLCRKNLKSQILHTGS